MIITSLEKEKLNKSMNDFEIGAFVVKFESSHGGSVLCRRNFNRKKSKSLWILMTWNVLIVISWDIININARNTEPS